MKPDGDLTASLNRWAREGSEALDELFPLVYEELRSLARAHLSRGQGSSTLQPTVLVNEAYLRLSKHRARPFAHRQEFYALASRLIRHILVDHVRERQRDKRGGRSEAVPLELAEEAACAGLEGGLEPEELLGLHEALGHLEETHPVQARVIELRFFTGLTHQEIAGVLDLSLATIERHWSVGKRRLASLLAPAPA